MYRRAASSVLLMAALLGGVTNADTPGSAPTFDWTAFGQAVSGRMPEAMKHGPELQRVRHIADQVARKLASMNVLPNFDEAGRLRGQQLFGPDHCYMGNCGHTSDCLYRALVGAGIPKKALKRVVVLKRQPDGMVEPHLNADHVALVYLDAGGPRTFDLWCAGRGQTTFACFALSEWNGLPLADWAQKMRLERYAYAYCQDHPELPETSPELLVTAFRSFLPMRQSTP
jgi:hypothetical protein